MNMTEDEWKKKLTPSQYRVLREKATDAPFTGDLVRSKDSGVYVCAGCGNPLFDSGAKFDSGSGWPSFYDVTTKGNVNLVEDSSHGMQRTEVVCAKCGGHLGHLFDDAPDTPTGQRFCINSTSLDFHKTNDSV